MRVVVGDRAAAALARDDGNAALDEGAQLVGRARPPHAAARDDRGPLRRAQHGPPPARRARAGRLDRGVARESNVGSSTRVVVDLGVDEVDGELEVHGSGRSGRRLA